MKNILIQFWMLLPILFFGQSDFQISGEIQSLNEGQFVYLIQNAKVDSAKVSDKKFVFNGKVEEPTLAYLNTEKSSKNVKGFYVSEENIKIVGDDFTDFSIEGSQINKDYESYTKSLDSIKQNIAVIKAGFDAMTEAEQKDPETLKKMGEQLNEAFQDQMNVRKNFMASRPKSMYSLMILKSMTGA
ncbi:DUF4369 domain-containing protein [Sphingobacterium hungaricum]